MNSKAGAKLPLPAWHISGFLNQAAGYKRMQRSQARHLGNRTRKELLKIHQILFGISNYKPQVCFFLHRKGSIWADWRVYHGYGINKFCHGISIIFAENIGDFCCRMLWSFRTSIQAAAHGYDLIENPVLQLPKREEGEERVKTMLRDKSMLRNLPSQVETRDTTKCGDPPAPQSFLVSATGCVFSKSIIPDQLPSLILKKGFRYKIRNSPKHVDTSSHSLCRFPNHINSSLCNDRREYCHKSKKKNWRFYRTKL